MASSGRNGRDVAAKACAHIRIRLNKSLALLRAASRSAGLNSDRSSSDEQAFPAFHSEHGFDAISIND
jgi:hypothetical protein